MRRRFGYAGYQALSTLLYMALIGTFAVAATGSVALLAPLGDDQARDATFASVTIMIICPSFATDSDGKVIVKGLTQPVRRKCPIPWAHV